MKLVWSPEMATKAFMDTVKFCKVYQGSSTAELISAMAAGWNAKLIVETWSHGGLIATSIGLAVAAAHTGGRHVCIVSDEDSRLEYSAALGKGRFSPEVIVGESAAAVVKGLELEVIDFLVVDSRKNDFVEVLTGARFGPRGAVVVCKNANCRATAEFRWQSLFDGGSRRRIVRSVFLPVGKGLDIAHVAAGETGSGSGSGSSKVRKSRWIKRVDRESGEEFLIRK